MTGPELKRYLFKEDTDVSVVAFAKWLGEDRRIIHSRFKARQVDAELLKKYARWRGIDENKFMLYAYGPAQPLSYQTPDTALTMVHEASTENYTKETPAMSYLDIIARLLDNQAVQNKIMITTADALKELSASNLLLAKAADKNADTISRLSIQYDDDKREGKRKQQKTEKELQ